LRVDVELVAKLKPELVVASLHVPGMEANLPGFERAGFTYLALGGLGLNGIWDDMRVIGRHLGREQRAEALIADMRERMARVAARSTGSIPRPRVHWEWSAHPFVAARRSWTPPYTNISLTTRFKPISGREDQAAGLIFRIQDSNNYYILRANALETNVNFYIYRGGTRSNLRGSNTPVAAGAWQELRVDVQANQFRAYLNGQQVADASDDSYKAGGVGLWTKADSVMYFDDVEVTAR
jgi:hypothetical protein